ncbi:hypothetical protein DPX16_14515 [Anabarilius grahami]|uniref:Uncharacterized protein n=1 Tax=Anabarilius grahami TaxID=495550 RepID=A0A3N0YYM9_ANAGA|nr:hypothetical protein DPX16_14515 [Anabarilius grahami]
MDFPPVKLKCLEQGETSIKKHLEEFLDLVHQTTFPDYCLSSFLYVELNATTRAQLSGKGPRGSFASYVDPLIPPPLSSVAPSQACWEPSPPGHEEPEAPPPAPECYKLPQSVALAPTPALLPPSTSEWTIGHLASPDSLGTSAPPRSDIASPPLRTVRCSPVLHPSAKSCSALPQASPPPSVAPTRPQTSGSLPRSQEVVAAAPSRPAGSSPSLHHLGSSAAQWAPSSPSSYPVIPMAALISVPPWLLPPSTPPWGTTLAVAWMNIQQPLLKAITWLSPPSSPPWTLVFHLLPVSRPPPEPPPASSARFTITSSTSRTPSGPPF